MEIAFILQDIVDSGLANRYTKNKSIIFPIDKAINVHYENNWKNLTGMAKFDNNFNTKQSSQNRLFSTSKKLQVKTL